MRIPADAHDKLMQFLAHEWELYNGIPVAQDTCLYLYEILLSIMMNSRLDTAEKVRSIWTGRGPVEEVLARIPAEVSLEAPSVPWDELAALFDAFCQIKHAKWAVATKILHKKRPGLIPIYDSVLSEYFTPLLTQQPKRGTSIGWKLVEHLKLFRTYLLECQPEIEGLCKAASASGWPITPVRAFESLSG